jgi:hypothetical protein
MFSKEKEIEIWFTDAQQKFLVKYITNRTCWPHSCIAKAEVMEMGKYIPSVSYNGTQ